MHQGKRYGFNVPLGSQCYWCRRPLASTVDHIIPTSLGGRNEKDNFALCCRGCNLVKGDMTPQEWVIVMRDIPEWWRLAEKRGPRGRQLADAMMECGFNFNLASNGEPYEQWWVK